MREILEKLGLSRWSPILGILLLRRRGLWDCLRIIRCSGLRPSIAHASMTSPRVRSSSASVTKDRNSLWLPNKPWQHILTNLSPLWSITNSRVKRPLLPFPPIWPKSKERASSMLPRLLNCMLLGWSMSQLLWLLIMGFSGKLILILRSLGMCFSWISGILSLAFFAVVSPRNKWMSSIKITRETSDAEI